MSCSYKVETFEKVEVEIKFDKDCFANIEKAAQIILKQKLDKINILLKNLNVYSCNNMLFVNDRYNTCSNIEEISKEFGLIIKKVNCNIKGKNYIITDELLGVLSDIGMDFELNKYVNKELTEEIQEILANNNLLINQDDNLKRILKTIYSTGAVFTEGTQKVISSYYNNLLRSQERGEIKSDQEIIRKNVQSYVDNVTAILTKGNSQLQNGTAKLLHHRARQMGYLVKEERKGTQVQLVLVRAE